MKNLVFTLVMVYVVGVTIYAQPPQAFKYQAVVRDAAGEVLQNQNVEIRISIHDVILGTFLIVYQETFTETTNNFGLVNLEIGTGTPVFGTFAGIDWGSNPKFLETEIKTGGPAFISMGTSELLSVPYALYSVSSGDTSEWSKNADTIYYDQGYVGIGTSSPGASLDVAGHIWQTGTGKSVFIGEGAGANDDLSGNQNVFIGFRTGYSNTTGLGNIFHGYQSGYDNTTGRSNIFVGYNTGSSNTSGSYNTIVGDRSGLKITTGESNTIIGHKSGMNNETGSNNVFIGHRSGYYETGSNKLYISNWSTGSPLIYGQFDDNILELNAQVTIGESTPPDASAALDVKSVNKGLLIPRMTQAEIAAIENPANGLQAFNLDDNKLYIHILEDHVWKEVQYGSGTINYLASYTIGTGGSCANTIVSGFYVQGVNLNSSNTVTLNVMVTSIGPWAIITDTVNNYFFRGDGVFTSTGTVQVTLNGSGVPWTTQTDSFTSTAYFGNGTCTFDVSISIPNYTIGTGGSCANTVVNGNYYEAVPLNGSNTVNLDAMVTVPGTWSISTNNANDFFFSGSGTFTSTGTIQVTLYGTGTPTFPQTTTFTATANNNNGTCTFSVSVGQPHICGTPFTYGVQSYNTISIGSQCWMTENLNIGTMINGGSNQTDNGIFEKYCYDNSTANCNNYGGLYQWNEMMQYSITSGAQGICPTGWIIPTKDDWEILTGFIGGSTHGNELKSCRQVGSPLGGACNTTEHPRWNEYSNNWGTDDYGFSGLPGGERYVGSFNFIGGAGEWWTSTRHSSEYDKAWYRSLTFMQSFIDMDYTTFGNGYSIRCLRDY